MSNLEGALFSTTNLINSSNFNTGDLLSVGVKRLTTGAGAGTPNDSTVWIDLY